MTIAPNFLRVPLACAVALAVSACGKAPEPERAPDVPAPVAAAPAAQPAPAPVANTVAAEQFLDQLRQHCGQAFEGRIVTNEPPQPDDAFAGKALVMHVRECGKSEVKVPFHVGDDHSRTWVLTLTGSHDAVTMYGGDTAQSGSATRQEFPVDAESIAVFEREGLTASVTNTWAMEIEPGKRFLYELSRPGGRLFQVEFDLGTPVELPPTPWGHPELP
jgi:hypothetical protein